MFRGVNHINLDAKGRMAFPTRYRELLTERARGQLVVTVDFDRDPCLLVYPMPDWEDIERKLVKLPSLNKRTRRLQRLLIGHATEAELDSAGRILLPLPLRQYAQLEKKVVMIGQVNRFEIWDESNWNAKREEWFAADEDEDLDMPSELDSLSL